MILHGAGWTDRCDRELAHAATNSAMISPASEARSCSAKVLASTGKKVTRSPGSVRNTGSRCSRKVLHGRSSEKMPAARRREALDACLHAADRDRSGRREYARTGPPWHVQGLVETGQIRPTRREADHRDAVVAAGMPRHDLVGRHVLAFRDLLEIDAVLAAIGNGNAPAARFRARLRRHLRECQQLLAERIEVDPHGIVVHQQRAIGRHRLGHALDLGGIQRSIERQHALVGGVIDGLGEFHRDGAVATRQQAGRG